MNSTMQHSFEGILFPAEPAAPAYHFPSRPISLTLGGDLFIPELLYGTPGYIEETRRRLANWGLHECPFCAGMAVHQTRTKVYH